MGEQLENIRAVLTLKANSGPLSGTPLPAARVAAPAGACFTLPKTVKLRRRNSWGTGCIQKRERELVRAVKIT